jgi:outer membrane protein OmpA-like peptidoglycan-associated protein
MLGAFGKLNVGLAAAVLAVSVGFGSIPAAAEQPTAAQILNALKPKPLTRSLSNPAAARKAVDQDEERFLDSVRAKPARLLSPEERARVATIALERPSIDLEINFDYNSASISRKALGAVTELGKALSSPELKNSVVLLAGHTDGKGGDEYNQGLSERRAEAIKRYLVEKFGLKAENLVAAGYGKTQLKNTSSPFADENRRVQVVNMESSKEARRN